MALVKVEASSRSGRGKSAARRLRGAGHIPAVAYGGGLAVRSLSVSPKSLGEILQGEFGRNTLIELEVDGKEKLTVLLGEYQYHPVSRELLHADFRTVSMDAPVVVEVPFELPGRSKGVVEGGVLRQVFRKLPVRCLPEKIPAKISYDITDLEIDQQVHVRDIALPDDVQIMLGAGQTVAAVVTEKRRGAEAEEAAPAEGATAAPEKADEKAGAESKTK